MASRGTLSSLHKLAADTFIASCRGEISRASVMQKGLQEFISVHGNSKYVIDEVIKNDIAKVYSGEHITPDSFPTLGISSLNQTKNNSLSSIPQSKINKPSDVFTAYMDEIEKLESVIFRSPIRKLNEIAERLDKITENLTEILDEEIIFSEQIAIYFKIQEAQYLILSEVYSKGRGNLPYYEDNPKLRDIQLKEALCLNIERISKYEKFFPNDEELKELIGELKREVTFYIDENIEDDDMKRLMKLTHEANTIIMNYEIEKGVQNLRVPNAKEANGEIITSYITPSGQYIEMRESVENCNDYSEKKALINQRMNGIRPGYYYGEATPEEIKRRLADPKSWERNFPIDDTGLNFYYSLTKHPYYIMFAKNYSDSSVTIEEYDSAFDTTKLPLRKVMAEYKASGDVTIEEYRNSDMHNYYQKYQMSVVFTENSTFFCKRSFVIDGHNIEIDTIKTIDIKQDDLVLDTVKNIIIDGQIVHTEPRRDNSLESGLFESIEAFNLSQYLATPTRSQL